MDLTVILSYILIIVGVVVWAVLLPGGRNLSPRLVDIITVFGGAFLLGYCFINLVPHIYIDGFATPQFHIKLGASVLLGFLVQLLLELLTHGVEHGHQHEHHHDDHESPKEIPLAGLMIGLCIHAFLEGMPLAESGDEVHQGLLYGIVLHNIPLALVMVSLFSSRRIAVWRGLLLLLLFAVMTPLGSLCSLFFLGDDPTMRALLMGFVVGILLHVSVSILFVHEGHRTDWWRVALIVLAFAAAYFTPGCPEIYG